MLTTPGPYFMVLLTVSKELALAEAANALLMYVTCSVKMSQMLKIKKIDLYAWLERTHQQQLFGMSKLCGVYRIAEVLHLKLASISFFVKNKLQGK